MLRIVLTPPQPTGPTDPVKQYHFSVEACSFRTLGRSDKVDSDEILQIVMAGTAPVRIAVKLRITPYNP